uniref:Uncharacterized protein n=1 Tax=Anguilla anguilla TaxID=7936 RepID=A0A0E9TZY0_ANGAN
MCSHIFCQLKRAAN